MKRFLLSLIFSSLLAPLAWAQLALTPIHYQQLNNLQQAFANSPAGQQNTAAVNQAKQLIEQVKGTEEQQAFVKIFAARLLAQHLAENQQLNPAIQILQQEFNLAVPNLELKQQQDTNWQLIHLLTQAAKYEEALKQLNIWWQQEEQPSAEAKYLHAALLAQVGRWQAASPYILQALQERQPESWLSLGVAVMQQLENWRKAAELQQLRLNFQPKNANTWLTLAQFQLLAKQEKAALVTLKLAQQQGYLPIQQIENLGLRLIGNKQHLLAAKLFEQLLVEDPSNLRLNQLAAQAWLLAKQPEATTQALERLAKISPSSRNFSQLGQWYFSQASWEAAAKNFNQALNLAEKAAKPNPRQLNLAKLNLAQSYIELNQPEAAKQQLNQLLNTSLAGQAKQWLNYLSAL